MEEEGQNEEEQAAAGPTGGSNGSGGGGGGGDASSVAPSSMSTVEVLLQMARLEEWEAYRTEIAAARSALQEREARLEALKLLSEEQAQELVAAHARINKLSTVGAELVEARKAALEATATSAASSPLTTHAQLLRTVKSQAEQLHGVVLPDFFRRLGAVEGREEENEAALVESRGAVERAQAMLKAHRGETERLLALVQSMGAQLAEAKGGQEEATAEVVQLRVRVESLEAALRDRDASLHDVRGQNRELLRQLATEKTMLRGKEDETTTLLNELSAARQRAVELSFKCNEASYSSSQARQEMLRLEAEVQALKEKLQDEAVDKKRLQEAASQQLQRSVALAAELAEEKQTSEKAAAEAFELGKKLHEATLLNQLLSRRSGAVGGGGGGGGALASFHLSVPAKPAAVVNAKAGEKEGKDGGGGLSRKTPPMKGGPKTTRGVGGKRPRSAASESDCEQGKEAGRVAASPSNGGSGSGKGSSGKGGGADVWEDEGGGVFGFADDMAPLVVEAPSTATRARKKAAKERQQQQEEEQQQQSPAPASTAASKAAKGEAAAAAAGSSVKKRGGGAGDRGGNRRACEACNQPTSGLTWLCQQCFGEFHPECARIQAGEASSCDARGFICDQCR